MSRTPPKRWDAKREPIAWFSALLRGLDRQDRPLIDRALLELSELGFRIRLVAPHTPATPSGKAVNQWSRPDPIDRPTPPLTRLAYRLDDIASLTGLSRRTLERERSAGRFPPPDLIVGRMPLWRPATIDRWLSKGGA